MHEICTELYPTEDKQLVKKMYDHVDLFCCRGTDSRVVKKWLYQTERYGKHNRIRLKKNNILKDQHKEHAKKIFNLSR